MEMTYTLSRGETDLKTGNFSNFSNWERLLKSVGEFAEITVPNGVLKFRNFRNIS
jgi:transcription elongation factor GreA